MIKGFLYEYRFKKLGHVRIRNMKAKRKYDQSLKVVKSMGRWNTDLLTKSQITRTKAPGA